jgi:hypothetical protein
MALAAALKSTLQPKTPKLRGLVKRKDVMISVDS